MPCCFSSRRRCRLSRCRLRAAFTPLRHRCSWTPAASLPSFGGAPAASQNPPVPRLLSCSSTGLEERDGNEKFTSHSPHTSADFFLFFFGWKQRTASSTGAKSWLRLTVGKQNTAGRCACVLYSSAFTELLSVRKMSLCLRYLPCSVVTVCGL